VDVSIEHELKAAVRKFEIENKKLTAEIAQMKKKIREGNLSDESNQDESTQRSVSSTAAFIGTCRSFSCRRRANRTLFYKNGSSI
jgi:hypothetical protein